MTPDWMSEAACASAGAMTERFFAPDGAHDSYYDPARKLCAGCPVLDICLSTELARMRAGEHSEGFIGGTTLAERGGKVKRRRRPDRTAEYANRTITRRLHVVAQ